VCSSSPSPACTGGTRCCSGRAERCATWRSVVVRPGSFRPFPDEPAITPSRSSRRSTIWPTLRAPTRWVGPR
jgi:hypothetical protein